MCFSAPASFSASIVLAGIGIATLYRVQAKRLVPLALTSLLFAIQQFFEGVLWLYLPAMPDTWLAIASKDMYVFFASLWPAYSSFSVWFAETSKRKKRIIFLFLAFGVIYSLHILATLPDFTASLCKKNIRYDRYGELFDSTDSFFYCIPFVSVFFSSIKKLWALMIPGFFSAIFILWFAANSFFSLWCFFAALFSTGLFLVLEGERKNSKN